MQYKINKKLAMSLMLKIGDESTECGTSFYGHEVDLERKSIREVAAKLRKIGDELNDEKMGNASSYLEGFTVWKFMWFYAVIKSL
jgi:hypothetical protein